MDGQKPGRKTHQDALVVDKRVGSFDVIGRRKIAFVGIDGLNSRIHAVSSQIHIQAELGKAFADKFGQPLYETFWTLDGHHVVSERIQKIRGEVGNV